MSSITVALAGNPNVGKSTLFNALTGSHQHVGNWPGKTVEKKEGTATFENHTLHIVDLPGTYTLTPYAEDEKIAREYILFNQPNVVVHVIDATNIERNLYLMTQLMELRVPIVIALNMFDLAQKNGITVSIEEMSSALKIPIIPIVASKKEGLKSLLRTIVETKKIQYSQLDYGCELEEKISAIEELLEDKDISLRRWIAINCLEYQESVLECSEVLKNKDKVISIKKELTDKTTDKIFSEKRYEFARSLSEKYIKKSSNDTSISDMIDRVVTDKYLGIPLFLIVVWLVFQFTFTLATPFVDIIDLGFSKLGEIIENHVTPSWLASLLSDGIIGGVGLVVVFFPHIFILFIILSLLEDSGYLARVAFVMDRLMTSLGLHGKSFLPLILGFGCSVPAIMAARSIDSKSDRIITILSAPFVSCSARLPIYLVLAGAFFGRHAATVIFLIYILGLVIAISTAKLLRCILFKGKTTPLIMELPSYKKPTRRTTLTSAWMRSSLYIKKAGTIIFAGAICIWLLASLPLGAEYGSEETYIAKIGKTLEPIVSPLGFDWKIAVALLFGLVAKEIVVSSLGILYGTDSSSTDGVSSAIEADPDFTSLIGLQLMVFTLIYTPCLAAVATIKHETNSWKYALFSVVYSLSLAYSVTYVIHIVGKMIL